MKFFKKSNKTKKYLKQLALENTENKKRIAELESQLARFSKLEERMVETLKQFNDLGNVDERLNDLENNQLTKSDVNDLIEEYIPGNLEDICYTYDEYDFSEFITQADVDETVRNLDFLTEDDVCNVVKELVNEALDKHNYEDFLDNWENPAIFMKFLNKLAKYVARETEE